MDAVSAYANKLGVKRDKIRPKHPSMMNISIVQFEKIEFNYVAYFLGFLWADGYISHYISKGTENNHIRIEINREDGDNLVETFNKLGKWSIYDKLPKRVNEKPQKHFCTNNRDLYNILFKMDYSLKSIESPSKILECIPTELHHYFWRGYFDGDGYIKYDNTYCVSFTGSFEQNWSDLEKLLGSMNIKYSISRYQYTNKIGKLNKYSKVLIQNKLGIRTFYKYLYPSGYDGIGLLRKYDKFPNNPQTL